MADQRHPVSNFLEEELPRLQAQWEAGHFSAVIDAFAWCSLNGYKFPDWLADAVHDELIWSWEHRPRGGTKLGNAFALERAHFVDRVRFLLVQHNLMFQEMRGEQPNNAQAARDAGTYLRGKQHLARGSTDAILKSYNRLKSG